jgi:hypothetical protein
MKKFFTLGFILILVISVSGCTQQKTPTCGNNLCESGEVCPEDCKKIIMGKGSFVGMDFHRDENLGRQYLDKFSNIGINTYGFDFLIWNIVEPSPPVNGVHTYDWSYPDEVINKIENVGGEALIKFFVASTWANREGVDYAKYGFRPSVPPKEKYWDDFGEFVQAVVERYDGDGYQDMPGLRGTHLFYQFEGEAEVHWQQGGGSKEEYVEMLEIFHNSVKKANDSANVIVLGFNLGDSFDSNPSLEDFNSMKFNKEEKEIKEFLEYVISNDQYFDIVGANCNYRPTGLPARMRIVREYTDKPVWCVDMAAGYLWTKSRTLSPLYTPDEYPFLTEKQVEETLKQGKNEEVLKWAMGEQSKYLLKKIATAAASGYERVYLQWIIEIQKPATGWVLSGLLDDNKPNIGVLPGTPRPSFWTLKMFNEKVGDFTVVEDLNPLPEGHNPTNWTWILKFIGENENFILWSNSGETIDLSEHIVSKEVRVNHIVTELDDNHNPIYPQEETFPSDSIPLTDKPVFIE